MELFIFEVPIDWGNWVRLAMMCWSSTTYGEEPQETTSERATSWGKTKTALLIYHPKLIMHRRHPRGHIRGDFNYISTTDTFITSPSPVTSGTQLGLRQALKEGDLGRGLIGKGWRCNSLDLITQYMKMRTGLEIKERRFTFKSREMG